MTEAEFLKTFHEIDLKTLGDGFAEVLSEHLGGTFRATVTKLEHTNPGGLPNKLLINFSVEDESQMARSIQNSKLSASRGE